jgi:hypothetical protein
MHVAREGEDVGEGACGGSFFFSYFQVLICLFIFVFFFFYFYFYSPPFSSFLSSLLCVCARVWYVCVVVVADWLRCVCVCVCVCVCFARATGSVHLVMLKCPDSYPSKNPVLKVLEKKKIASYSHTPVAYGMITPVA